MTTPKVTDGVDLFSAAMLWQFNGLENKTGWELLNGSDADLLALLALAGQEEAGLDQIYAEVIVTERHVRMVIEQARLRNLGDNHAGGS